MSEHDLGPKPEIIDIKKGMGAGASESSPFSTSGTPPAQSTPASPPPTPTKGK